MKGKVSAGILGIASVMGGVDASTLHEQPLDLVENVAGYEIQVEQIDNTVEANLPWKDQPGISVAYDMGKPSIAERFADKRDEQVIVETVDIGDGGFKIDVILNEKPSTNRFCYQIEGAENYDFFYQPPLTEQEIAEGASRPPEIEGSYAVYHKTLKNHVIGQENYATGKVMHIPRPQVWEMANEEATKQWADLSYENGQLCVTAPQDFLDTATYPVRIDPTFGYTTVGATPTSLTSDRVEGSFTKNLPISASIETISVYTETDAGVAYRETKGALYDVSTNGIVAEGRIARITVSSPEWFELPIQKQISASDYYISFGFDAAGFGSGGTVFYYYDTVGSANRVSEAITFPNVPSTATPVSSTREISIYATYINLPNTLRLNNGTLRINNGTLDL